MYKQSHNQMSTLQTTQICTSQFTEGIHDFAPSESRLCRHTGWLAVWSVGCLARWLNGSIVLILYPLPSASLRSPHWKTRNTIPYDILNARGSPATVHTFSSCYSLQSGLTHVPAKKISRAERQCGFKLWFHPRANMLDVASQAVFPSFQSFC